MVDKKQKKSFKTRYLDKGVNLVSIITGVIITFVIWYFISMITYTIIPPTNTSIFNFDLIYSVEIIGISVIGGFVATYIGNEEQLLNGICVGLGIILISIVLNVYVMIIGQPNPYWSSPLIIIIGNLGYISAPTLGSYLAIRATKDQF
jgi:putative membrane protein (TIGR04086 family)